MFADNKGLTALRARFAGLGIAAFATVAIVTSAPTIALAEESDPVDNDQQAPATLIVTDDTTEGTGSDTNNSGSPAENEQGSGEESSNTSNEDTGDSGDGAGTDGTGSDSTGTDGTDGTGTGSDGTGTDGTGTDTDVTDGTGTGTDSTDTVGTDGIGTDNDDGEADGTGAAVDTDDSTSGDNTGGTSIDEKVGTDDSSTGQQDSVESNDSVAESTDTVAPTGTASTTPAVSQDESGTTVETPKEENEATATATSAPAKATVVKVTAAAAPKVAPKKLTASNDLSNWENGKWVTVKVNGQTRRYWQGADGTMYKGGLIDPTWGVGKKKAGFWAFSSPKSGYAVISPYAITYKGKKMVFLADSNGKLMTPSSGWVVTGKFTNGALQRYYIDPNLHGAVVGYAAKSNGIYAHYTLAKYGYVLRGTKKVGKKVYIANNDGKLLTGEGWKTSSITGKKRRYYLKGGYAQSGLFEVDGNHYYGTKKGHVLTSPTKCGKGYLVPDKTGALRWKKGWYVGGRYNNGTVERYYFADVNGDGKILAPKGLFKAKLNGATRVFYGTKKGYVLRNGSVASGKYYYVADGESGAMTRTNDQPLNSRQQEARARANNETSSTKYLITIDQRPGQYWLYIWQKVTAGSFRWKLVDEVRVGVGLDETPTYNGRSTVLTSATRYQLTPGSNSVIYATAFQGGGWHMHSTVNPYSENWASQVGRQISHGCVRMNVEKAKWIYENIGKKANGTKVYIYGGKYSQ